MGSLVQLERSLDDQSIHMYVEEAPRRGHSILVHWTVATHGR